MSYSSIETFADAVGRALEADEFPPPPLGLAPRLAYGRHRGPGRIDSRRAAVIIAVYPHASSGQLCITLTRRPISLSHHGGQVCLPGGRIEPGESSYQAAVREYEEELGVPIRGVNRLGQLPPTHVFASDNRVDTWVVAADPPTQPWQPDPGEVDRVIELPLAGLSSVEANASDTPDGQPAPGRVVQRKLKRSGKNTDASQVFEYSLGYRAIEFVDCEGMTCEVWGATAMLLGQFASIAKNPACPSVG